MTDTHQINTNNDVMRSTRLVFDLLQKVAGLTAGFLVLAYVAGSREASVYYSMLGAPWVPSLLNTSQIMQTSQWLMTTLVFFSLASAYLVTQGRADQAKLRKWSIYTLFLGALVGLISIIFKSQIKQSPIGHLTQQIGSMIWIVSAGFTVGELIACHATDKFEWSKYSIFLLAFIFCWGIFPATFQMGVSKASLTGDMNLSTLPRVALSNADQAKEWRLVAPCGDKLLLVSLAKESKNRRFKLVSAEAIDEIYEQQPAALLKQ